MADRDEEVAREIALRHNDVGVTRALIDDIATALRQAREEGRPKWQTIDAAPKGEKIIVGRHAVQNGLATLPAYSGEAFWSETRQAWCFLSEFFNRSVMEYDNPTHWMPLPTPPGGNPDA